ncbi:ABC transporter permease subunit [Paraburkholderia sp.]|uniref:ABC transporter permease subunit n=1 Tax=Paraburkholderia sp. TaxID=1926495 RepID=UPI003C7D59D1
MSEIAMTTVPKQRFRIPSAAKLRSMPIYVWLIPLILLPNVLMLFYSFLTFRNSRVVFDPTVASYARMFTSPSVWYLLLRTLRVSAASAGIAMLIAYPMALYASNMRRGKSIAVMLVIIPLWISLLMRIFAWRIILGENGVINTALVHMGLISKPIESLLYSPFAVFLTFVYTAIPFVFISVFSVIDRIPTSLSQAASDCGASEFRVFTHVIWPLSKPGVAIGVALAFLIAVGDYVTPSIVGGLDGTMLGTVIASQFGMAGNWPYGAALSLMLLVVVALASGLLLSLLRVRGSAEGDAIRETKTEKAFYSAGERLGNKLKFCLFVLPFLILYAPLVLLTVFSFNNSTVQTLPLQGFTFHWYESILQTAPLLAALRQSLVVGGAVLGVSVVCGTVFAVLLTYGHLRFRALLEKLLLLPLALPGIILGITLVLTFHALHVPAGLPRLVLGHSTFVMPVIMSVVVDRLRRLDPSLLNAAMDLGAGPGRTFLYILFPLVKSAIFGGALLGLTLSIDEVVISTFLVADQPTLPVWVLNQMRFGFTPSVNAIFVCIGLATFTLIVLSQYIIRRK